MRQARCGAQVLFVDAFKKPCVHFEIYSHDKLGQRDCLGHSVINLQDQARRARILNTVERRLQSQIRCV